MAQRIVPSTKVITKDGECHLIISLELDINVNVNGETSVQNVKAQAESKKIADSDDFTFAIPDFSMDGQIDFGTEIVIEN